jgi:hypothetical protein
MRRRILPVLGLFLLSACAHRAALPRTQSPAESISAGVTHRILVRSRPTPLVMHVVEIDLARAPGALKVVANQSAPDGGMIATAVSQLAAKAGFSVAVNASFFQVPGERPVATALGMTSGE